MLKLFKNKTNTIAIPRDKYMLSYSAEDAKPSLTLNFKDLDTNTEQSIVLDVVSDNKRYFIIDIKDPLDIELNVGQGNLEIVMPDLSILGTYFYTVVGTDIQSSYVDFNKIYESEINDKNVKIFKG